jgi:decaprenylphospho-beta-D-ribofuranose 2-oxidase
VGGTDDDRHLRVSRERLTGWGRTAPALSDVVTPLSEADIATHLATAPHVIARGLGRSYGDAAQLSGGLVLNNRGLTGISAINEADGTITVGAGVSIDELLYEVMSQGYFVPVTPGTRQVTIGGAVAADVHGKNHHVDGSFASHVVSMRLVTPTGVHALSATQEPDLFWATMGAMGLTGVVSEVTMKLLTIETDHVVVDTDRYNNLDAVMSAMLSGDERYRYSVAWVDCMTRGSSMGRSILTRADHATRADVDVATLASPKSAKLAVPFNAPSGLLNSASIRIFNELWFRAAPQHREREPQAISSFFHPLDFVRGWNRLYGSRGFVQYQFVVPDHEAETVTRAISLLSQSRVPSFLAVLKRFGPANPAPLSFPMRGWTLALDLPVGPAKLPSVLDQLDEMVMSAGGRVYLAKDSRLDAASAVAMYPRLAEFRDIKNAIDPEHVITSDLARRIGFTQR